MSGQIKRSQVNWDVARCKGMDTQVFFADEDRRNDRTEHLKLVRRICFLCPIRQDCMEVGFEYEEYGVWGGIASSERREIRMRRYDSEILTDLYEDLDTYGISRYEVTKVRK